MTVIHAPPSTTNNDPVTNEESGLDKYRQASAISVLVPHLCSGMFDSK